MLRMNRFSALLCQCALALTMALGALPHPAAAAPAMARPAAPPTAHVRDDATLLRAGPGRSYQRIATLQPSQALHLLARHAEWVKVAAHGIGTGWVRQDMLVVAPTILAQLATTNAVPAPAAVWVWPTRGAITSPFGWRREPRRSYHNGIDIANAKGTPIRAARAGVVIEAGWCRGFGYCVKVQHAAGFVSIYGHLATAPSVRVGAQVAAGDRIGAMGMTFDRHGGGYVTGVHLHFTIKHAGEAVNPLNYLPRR